MRGIPSAGLRRRTISAAPSRSCVSGAERFKRPCDSRELANLRERMVRSSRKVWIRNISRLVSFLSRQWNGPIRLLWATFSWTRNRGSYDAAIHRYEHPARLLPTSWVYPGFPTIFRGLSEFFVGDLMGKALWKLVENAQRFPRRGGRVLCVHGPVSFHRARPCATKWPPRRGLRTGPPASSDCGRP